MKYALIVISLIASLVAEGSIRQIQTYKQVSIESLGSPASTLVIFDLDNTLIEPTQTLGSDQWGSLQQKRLKEAGVPEKEAVDRGVAMFSAAQMATKVKTVEGVTLAFLTALNARGYKIMALTARPLNLVNRTLEELRSVGISFDRSRPVQGDFALNTEVPSVYKRGILFVGPHNVKAQVLLKFFEQSKMNKPKAVAFFDDKQHHVDAMEATIIPAGYAHLGFRYGAADEKVKSMNSLIGDLQWMVLNLTEQVISDENAAQLIKTALPLNTNIERDFTKVLKDSSEGPYHFDGCSEEPRRFEITFSTQVILCSGTVTALMFGGHPIDSTIQSQYILLPNVGYVRLSNDR